MKKKCIIQILESFDFTPTCHIAKPGTHVSTPGFYPLKTIIYKFKKKTHTHTHTFLMPSARTPFVTLGFISNQELQEWREKALPVKAEKIGRMLIAFKHR